MELRLYYSGKTLSDMEVMLRNGYLLKSGWLESAERKLALRNGEPVPWFTYAAIDFLEKNISPDLSLFEYGGGQSTLFWARRLREVVAIDHDPSFVEHIAPLLPANAKFYLVPEGQGDRALLELHGDLPTFTDPEITEHVRRSGQLNNHFQAYGLELLRYPPNTFDIVVVDGMARNLCTWAAIKHFRKGGFIVFDNSERDSYSLAYTMLADEGYRRIDFSGLGPINPYSWCTSVFYKCSEFRSASWFAVAPKKLYDAQTGILVIGYNRPFHLQSVLESLRMQGCLNRTHVWIDGTQGRGEFFGANKKTVEVAKRYPVRQIHETRGHLGIEKLMLDSLNEMTSRYARVIVLEDDCFPKEGAIEVFEAELNRIADKKYIYSVYGCHFGNENPLSREFSRFQGWGWAAHSDQIKCLLPDLTELYLMTERQYVAHISEQLTPDIASRLDTTPGRNVLGVLSLLFSWDSATAFVTAKRQLVHSRTPEPVVVNTGICEGIGHFHRDCDKLRSAPFNMITLNEAWSHYDTTTKQCDASRASYGLDELDIKIVDILPAGVAGFFIEIGANDGVSQSNSVLLEKAGWRGMLIEALPAMYAKCCKSRPSAIVEHAACVPFSYKGDTVTVTDIGLMSMAENSTFSQERRRDWIARGEGFARRRAQDIEVPAMPLSLLLDKHGVKKVDLLLLDVEGAEVGVLDGLDFGRHAPRFIVAEDNYSEELIAYLKQRGYTVTKILSERAHTRDIFYTLESAG